MLELTLLIADDHPLFRAALKEAVGRHVPGARIIEASSLDTLQHAVADYPDADLILLDLRMPGAKGFSALLYLRAEAGDVMERVHGGEAAVAIPAANRS